MTPSDYVQWLLTTNLQQLDLSDDSDFGTPELISNFGFGLLEEEREYALAKAEDKPKEAGDVLAYYTLLAVSLGFSRDYISGRIASTSTQFTVDSPVLGLAGSLKRLFRGDGSSANVEGNAFLTLLYVITNAGIPADALADLNKRKLTERLERTSTFHGSGDNR